MDKESSARSKEMAKVFTDNNIELYHTENEGKAIICERVIRFLRESLAKLETKNELEGENESHNNWCWNLPIFLDYYQNHWHRSIRMSPLQARDPINHPLLKRLLFHRFFNQKTQPPKYSVGDKVRIFK